MGEDRSGEVYHASVRSIVEFILRSGDIDNTGAGGPPGTDAMQMGARFHKKIQSMRGTGYRSEVPLSLLFPCKKYDVLIDGRADGIFYEGTPSGNVCIEEIKGTFSNIFKMKEPVTVHLAQAKCYAYMFICALDGDKKPDSIDIKMTYVNMASEKMREFDLSFGAGELKKWFEDLMGQYERWLDIDYEWIPIRQASIKALKFPFEYREGQRKLAVSVYQTILEEKKLYLEAPTGCGKTLSVLFPSVKSMGEGLSEKIFYLTAKTITRTAPEEAFDILRAGGLQFKTVTLTAREKICFLEKTDCNPAACKYAKGHFDRINEALYALVTEKRMLSRDVILEYALKYCVCPFELSLDASLFSDGIIGDYNYLFDPHARLRRFFETGEKRNFIFLVDEAHNLVPRGREMFSASLNDLQFKALRNTIRSSLDGAVKSQFFKKDYSGRVSKSVSSITSAFKRIKETYGENAVIAGFEEEWYLYETGIESLVRAAERLQGVLSEYFAEREKPGRIQQELRDVLLDAYFGISDFLSIYENMQDDYVIYDTYSKEEGFTVHLFCADPGRNIAGCLAQGRASVLFSATMLPIQYYKSLLGGSSDDYEVYAESVFDPSKRGIFIAGDVTTRYRERTDDEFFKTADYISRIVSAKSGNYMVFFPSYAYMRRVLEIFESGFALPSYDIAVQGESMTEKEREKFLELFDVSGIRSLPDSDTADSENDTAARTDGPAGNDKMHGVSRGRTLIGFCVMGGIFSEGIDLKGDSLIGVICVGPGIPGVDLKQNILRTYFDGYDHKGYEYAYMYPGMNKVLQAAGRVIRTEEDCGIVALLDKRFLGSEYRRLFPREWTDIRIVDTHNIKGYITDFWDAQ